MIDVNKACQFLIGKVKLVAVCGENRWPTWEECQFLIGKVKRIHCTRGIYDCIVSIPHR